MDRQAILAVSFGTSHFDTLEKTIAAIEAELAAAFPERTLRRAFTSGMILRKLEKEGTHIDDVPQAPTWWCSPPTSSTATSTTS